MSKTSRGTLAAAAGAVVIVSASTVGAVLGVQDRAAAVSPTVPDEFAPYVAAGAQVCEVVDAPLLAGVLDASSRFDASATGPAGQQGPAQLLPETWDVVGAQVDTDGHVVGVPGSGDPHDPGDATMAVARVLCALDEDQRADRESGDIAGERGDLVLAAYVAGYETVRAAGGVPAMPEVAAFLEATEAAAQRHGEGE